MVLLPPTDSLIESQFGSDVSLGIVEPVISIPFAQPVAKARVLHVINGEHFAGAERVQDLLALNLSQHGYDVGFASLKPGRFGLNRASQSTPLFECNMRGRFDLRPVRKIIQIVREEGYELLHAHTPRSLLIASIAANHLDLPIVYHVHSPTSRDSTRWLTNQVNHTLEKWSARKVSQLITVSPTLTDHMLSCGYEAERLTCVLNGVPTLSAGSPGARIRRTPVEPLIVGMVALFRPRKGTEVLLDALAMLRSQGHNIRLEAIGPFETPEYEASLHERADRLGLNQSVHWAGFTDDVHSALARVDVLALPSLFGEGLPMVVLEAMAAGLPVVASRCEGTSIAIHHRQTGLLVDPNSVSQLAGALSEIATGEIHYPSMSLAARELHEAKFSAEAMAEQVAKVYDSVLD